jgi:hypothetical protein
VQHIKLRGNAEENAAKKLGGMNAKSAKNSKEEREEISLI